MKRAGAAVVVILLLAVAGFVAVSGSVGSTGAAEEPRRPNVVVINIDGLSAGHLQCLGYHRETAPFLCDFGRRNVMFSSAVSDATWTVPAVGALFSGRTPRVRGIITRHDRMPDDTRLIAERLRSRDYTTVAYAGIGPGTSFGQPERRYNLDQGFQYYLEGTSFSKILPAALDWVETGPEQPFFLYLHGYDVLGYMRAWEERVVTGDRPSLPETNYSGPLHDPDVYEDISSGRGLRSSFVNRSGTIVVEVENGSVPLDRRDIEHVKAHYDARVEYVDTMVRRFIQGLEEVGAYDDTMIIITSAHGENLFDDMPRSDWVIGHGVPTEDVIRIPMMIRYPDGRSATVPEMVQLSDIAPTVMDRVDPEAAPRRFQGRSVAPLTRRGIVPSLRRLLSSVRRNDSIPGGAYWSYAFTQGLQESQVTVRSPGWTYVRYPSKRGILFRIRDGRRVRVPAADRPAVMERHLDALESWRLWTARLENRTS